MFFSGLILGALEASLFTAPLFADDDPWKGLLDVTEEKATPTPTKAGSFDSLERKLDQLDEEVMPPPKIGARVEFAKDAKHYEVTPVEDYKFKLLLESIITDTQLDIPNDIKLYKGAPWKEWKRDTLFMDAELKEMTLRFQYAGEKVPQGKPNAYYVSVSFSEERPLAEQMASMPIVDPKSRFKDRDNLTVRHSMPKKESERGGYRILTDVDKQQRIFLKGRDDTSMVVIIPNIKQRDTRAVLLCPRDFDPWKFKGGYTGMHNTNYEMVAVETTAVGQVQAGVISGFGPGLARAQILTSDEILPSRFSMDESMLHYPSVTLEYQPFGKKKIVPINNESISAGVVLQTVHHNSLNQKTVSTGEVKMTAKKIVMKKPFIVALNLNNEKNKRKKKTINFTVEAGPCYAIIKQKSLTHTFIKELLPKE